jgi:hypothetical protein
LLRGRCSVPMTNTPIQIQIAEHAPSRPTQRELSREANLSPKFEALGARQGRREMLDFDCFVGASVDGRRRPEGAGKWFGLHVAARLPLPSPDSSA